METTSNTIYSKDDATVTIFGDHSEHGECVIWTWENDGEAGEEVFALGDAVRELEMAGRDDLGCLVRQALEGSEHDARH